MSGNTLQGFTSIRASKEVVDRLQEEYCKRDSKTVTPKVTKPCESVEKQLAKAKEDSVFLSYYNGDRPNKDESVDDIAFMQKIVFWFGRDYQTCAEVFFSSPHYQTKSTRHKDKCERADYLPRTFEYAEARQERSYFDEDTIEVKVGGLPHFTSSTPIPNNDKGNAQRYALLYGDIVKYDHNQNGGRGWIIWNGKRWVKDDTAQVHRYYNDMIEQMHKECLEIEDEKSRDMFLKWIVKCGSNFTSEATMKEVAKLENISARTDSFDRSPYLFNAQNGTIDLNTFELTPHNPDNMITQISQTELGEGKPKRWIQFIDEITGGNKELASYLQRCIGYSMTGSAEEQCIFFLYGMGANGKSTFLDIITAVMGDYAKNVESRTLMVKKHDSSANSDIARLKGSRFVTAVESNEGGYLDESLVKHITSGEIVTARFLYGNEFQYVPQFKIWMATNHKPKIKGTDKGIWRRIKLIPFTVTFDDAHKDIRLKDKLMLELPDIMNWCLEGVQMWREQGLKEPTIVEDTTKEYMAEMNSIGRFMDECVIVTNNKNDSISTSQLYEKYKQWATAHILDMENLNRFGRRVSELVPIKTISNGKTVYRGIKVVDNFDDMYEDAEVDSFTSTGNIIQLAQHVH
jgi:putative DNA primase/helicase